MDSGEGLPAPEDLREVFPELLPFQFLWGMATAPTGERFLTLVTYHATGETTLYLSLDTARTFFAHGLDSLDRIAGETRPGMYLPKGTGDD